MRTVLVTLRKRKLTYKTSREFISNMFFWAFGGFLYAVAVNTFTAPNGILLGGFTGVATVLNYLFKTPIGTVVFLMNVPVFLIAFRKFGYSFILKTLVATFLASFMIDFTSLFLPVYSGDKLLSSLFGGVVGGAGLAIIFLRGATTGGVDIIAKLLLLRFPHMSMGRAILLMDCAVIAASYFVYHSLENLLYAVIVIYVSAQAIDYILYGAGQGKILYIVTVRYEELVHTINNKLHRGVSVLDMHGGYTGEPKKMLFCAVKAQEVARFTRTILEADADAFMVVSDAGEILGEGFRRREENAP